MEKDSNPDKAKKKVTEGKPLAVPFSLEIMKDNIKNILSIYKLATPQEIKDGIAWYLEAYKISNEIAIEYELPLNIVVGVIASLSPNNKWDRNILNAKDFCIRVLVA